MSDLHFHKNAAGQYAATLKEAGRVFTCSIVRDQFRDRYFVRIWRRRPGVALSDMKDLSFRRLCDAKAECRERCREFLA